MSEADINNLGVPSLETFCDEMMPSSDAEEEAEGVENELSSDPPSLSKGVQPTITHVEEVLVLDKPKRSWNRKIYPTSVVHRSARVKLKKK